MDRIYTKSYLKNFLNTVYISNLDNKQISNFLSELITTKKNQFDDDYNNYLILLILTCINKNNLTYQNQVLINEIISSLLLDQIANENTSKETIISHEAKEECCAETEIRFEDLDLNDKRMVKKYFLQQNKHLEASGNFNYPCKGKTAIINCGDNMTIPGVHYSINYVIDSEGNILDIKGYPKAELAQEEYETIYSDLIDTIFKD